MPLTLQHNCCFAIQSRQGKGSYVVRADKGTSLIVC